jgi:hypothetical protein
MEKVILEILGEIDGPHRNLPPTHLYNEGWMLCLILYWFSNNRHINNHEFGFLQKSRWYSEALLSSPFLTKCKKNNLSESYTHADGVIGDFQIGHSGKGDLVLNEDCEQFIVIEAKMYSKLSQGIKNARDYDQVTRNIACMSHLVAKLRLDEKQFKKLGFFVLAPEEQIIKVSSFSTYTDKENIKQKVLSRVKAYKSK